MATEAIAALVDVKDEQGNMLGRVNPGDTKTQALERVGRSGRLFDKNSLGLLGQDHITLEKGPYLFKEEIPPQQNVRYRSTFHGLKRNAAVLEKVGGIDFEGLIENDHAAALECISKLPYSGRFPDSSYCSPYTFGATYNEEVTKKLLRNAKNEIISSMRSAGPQPQDGDSRSPLVIGLRLGSGCGKTHLLLNAPAWLGSTGFHVTYNQGQDLAMDRKKPKQAILLRILLRSHGVSNLGCAVFLNSEQTSQWFLACNEFTLIKLVVYRLKELRTSIVIGVDELRNLSGDAGAHQDAVRLTASVLGQLVADFYKETSQPCTILLSSLTATSFTSVSDRRLKMIEPPQFDEGTIDFIIRGANGEGGVDVKQKAAILGCSGYHIRSIVQSAETYLRIGGAISTVKGILNQTVDRMKTNISTTDYHLVRKYIVEACRSGTVPGLDNVAVELLVDGKGALPPAIVCLVCGQPAGNIFENTFHTDAPTQLEMTAMQYDLFRAQYELPVIPTSMTVVADNDDATWFNDLRFCNAYEQKSESLLKTEKGGNLVSTGLLLCRGAY
eukprot:CAMPEP_0198303934 /NCGR_PEP_ID=MMETSP1449-20131203/57141_1 /TAXON_ID=420275 /ORGANISM="Attheya septentrionalis, Strain CCMP2084" /LENGTH=555 /DNA_ID=CAMNT_0044006441 /DNA_START=142 /DNA_END=1809 /DNA_ORIENTATION=+